MKDGRYISSATKSVYILNKHQFNDWMDASLITLQLSQVSSP